MYYVSWPTVSNQSTVWICVGLFIINVQVKLLHCYANDFVSFGGIGIELGNLSGHRTLIAFYKLIADYMYTTHKFSWLFSQHGQEKWVREFWKLPWVATMLHLHLIIWQLAECQDE